MRRHESVPLSPLPLPPEALDSDHRFATTLASGLELLRCFTVSGPALGNRELADLLRLPKSTISRLTFTLTALGFLRKNQALGKYELGPAVLTISYPLLANMRARFAARGPMRELTDVTGGQSSMAIRHGFDAVYVESYRPRESWINRPEIGSTRPVMRTAIGHALLYATPAEERERLMALHRQLEPKQARADINAFRRSIGEIEHQGFCTFFGHYRPELWAVAVPMRTRSGAEPVAFNLSLLAVDTTRERMESEFGPKLVGLVRNVEAAVGTL